MKNKKSNLKYNPKNDQVNTYKYIYTGIKSDFKVIILFILSTLNLVLSLVFYPVPLILSPLTLTGSIKSLKDEYTLIGVCACTISILSFLLSLFIFVTNIVCYS